MGRPVERAASSHASIAELDLGDGFVGSVTHGRAIAEEMCIRDRYY